MTTLRDVSADLLTAFPLEISKSYLLTPTVRLIKLRSTDGNPLPTWTPGAHITLNLGDGMKRSYSLCGSLEDQKEYTVAVRVEEQGRGGSRKIFHELDVGDRLEVEALRNNFHFASDVPAVFLAAGIGITPLLPMLRQAVSSGQDWHLYFANRARDDAPFLDEIAKFGSNVRFHFDDTDGLPDLGSWQEAVPSAHEAQIYCCGPGGFLEAAQQAFHEAVDGGRFRHETFSPAEDNAAENAPFEVVVESTGERLTVGTAETLLDRLRSAGYGHISSCEEGTCGTCEVGVLAGEVDHRDQILTDEERQLNEFMYPCVSRAKSQSLTIEL